MYFTASPYKDLYRWEIQVYKRSRKYQIQLLKSNTHAIIFSLIDFGMEIGG